MGSDTISTIKQFPDWPVLYWAVLLVSLICLICLMIAIKNVKKRRQRFGIETKDVTQEETDRASQTLSVIPCLGGCQRIMTVECKECREPIEGCSDCYKVYSPCSCGKQQSEEQNSKQREEHKEQNEENGAKHEDQRTDSVVSTISRKSSVYRPCPGGCQHVATLECEHCHEPVQGCLDCYNVLSPCSCIEEQNVESQHKQNENEEQNMAQSEKQSSVQVNPPATSEDLPPADDDQIRNGHFGKQINEPKSTEEYQRLNKMYRNCCDERQERDEQIKNLSADLEASLKNVGNVTEKFNEMAEMKKELLTSLKIVGHLNENLHKRSEFQKRCENEITEIKHQIKQESESLRNIQKQNERILQQTQQNKRSKEISRNLSKLSKINRMIRKPRTTNSPLHQICHEVADGNLRCQSYAPQQVIRHRATSFRSVNESAYDSNSFMDIPEIHDLSKTDMMGELDTVSLEQEIQRRKDCRKYSRIQRGRPQEIEPISQHLGKMNKSGKCVR